MKYFPPFRFDEQSRVLTRSGTAVPMTRKAADLLGCLLAQPGAMVSHQELVKAVWPSTHVQPENLKALVHELRSTLGDHADAPHFIRSEPGRGYTFVASVSEAMVPLVSDAASVLVAAPAGRERELAVLDRHLSIAALQGDAQVVVIDGERGIGKTSLCEAFAQHALQYEGVRISYSQGLDGTGAVQDFGLLIDAIDVLARQYPALISRVFAQMAPAWLSRLPRLADDRQAAQVELDDLDANMERMARELAAALDEIAAERPLVLVFDDLQSADPQSIACLQMLAHRRARSRLCLVLTFNRASGRPSSVAAMERLTRDLRGRQWGGTITLGSLNEAEMLLCLEQRIGHAATALIGPVFLAASGNPAMATRVIAHLVRLGTLYETPLGWQLAESPDGIEALLAESIIDAVKDQVDRLTDDDRAILEAAASVGRQFSAASVVAALDLDVSHTAAIERHLRAMSSEQRLFTAVGAGAAATSPRSLMFCWRHPLVPQVLVDGGPVGRQLKQTRLKAAIDTTIRRRA